MKKVFTYVGLAAFLGVGFLAMYYLFFADDRTVKIEGVPTGRIFDAELIIEDLFPGSENQRVTYPRYKFSFAHPKNLEIISIDESQSGETLIAQLPETSNEKLGFQIFITPYEGEEGVLTVKKILEDVPTAVINDAAEVLIGEAKSKPALLFFSDSEEIGRTREIWFIHEGHLFEISTYAELDSWIGPITETFRFLE